MHTLSNKLKHHQQALPPEANGMLRNYYVYIMTNKRRTVLYTGVTNDLQRRVSEHKMGKGSGFTSKYHAYCLVYWEWYTNIGEAIAREKQIKAGSRQDKIDLILRDNPQWRDLSLDWDNNFYLPENPDGN